MTKSRNPNQQKYPCYHCAAALSVRAEVCPVCGEFNGPRFYFEEFFSYLERGEIVNAKLGGYVVGRKGSQDDIPLIKHIGARMFQLIGFMQGGEYLIGVDATAKHIERLKEINAEKGPDSVQGAVTLTDSTSIINTNLVVPSVMLWIGSQYIVNRHATAKYFDELEALNSWTI